jgi:N-acetylglucosamine malate deacetylase 1
VNDHLHSIIFAGMVLRQKILILAPHTDDGELGCGGLIAKACNEHKETWYVAFSTCRHSLPEGLPADTLEKECRRATASLGIKKDHLLFYNFDVRTFADKRQEILDEMVQLNKRLAPELVCIPSASDMHQDHQVIHTEGLRAFKNSTMLGYELPWNHNRFQSTLFVTITPDELEKKVQSLAFYNSQANRSYMHPDFIRSLAKVRGVQSGNEYAESFEVYKMIS